MKDRSPGKQERDLAMRRERSKIAKMQTKMQRDELRLYLLDSFFSIIAETLARVEGFLEGRREQKKKRKSRKEKEINRGAVDRRKREIMECKT